MQSVGHATAPVPHVILGWIFDPSGNGFCPDPVELEVLIDLQSAESKSTWPTLKSVAKYYGPKVCTFSI